MRVLFAAPVFFNRITFFISQYTIGLAKAARRLGHDVRVVQTTENMYNANVWPFLKREFATLRRYCKPFVDLPHDLLLMFQILNEVKEFKPDLLFMHLIDTAYCPSVLKNINRRGVRTVVWLGVHPSQVSSGVHRLLRSANHTLIYDCDYVDFYRNQLQINNLKIMPLGCDTEYYDSVVPEKEYMNENNTDVCFIGLFDRHRETYLRALSDFNLGIWSWNMQEFETDLKRFHRGIAYDKEMIRTIKSSKIALNIHRDFEISGGNYRLFEIPACGIMQIVDDRPAIGKYFEKGKEIVTFSNPHDLKEKVAYYLNHPDERERIAQAGYDRVRKDHTLDQRFEMILRLAKA